VLLQKLKGLAFRAFGVYDDNFILPARRPEEVFEYFSLVVISRGFVNEVMIQANLTDHWALRNSPIQIVETADVFGSIPGVDTKNR
jgi:hypothetical protein